MRAWALGRAIVAFWVDFVVGDDWVVAAGVGVSLLATWGLVRLSVAAWWLLPVAVIAVTALSLRRATGRR